MNSKDIRRFFPVKKRPNAPPQEKPVERSNSEMNSKDIRRFFPVKKRPNAPQQQKPVELSDSEKNESPGHWKPYEGFFEDLRRYEKESEKQGQNSPSPAIMMSPKICPIVGSPKRTSASPKQNDTDLPIDEKDDREFDFGFEAFMAAIEVDVENYEDGVESFDGASQPELLRPEPRAFGNDLSNMQLTSNQHLQPNEPSIESHQPTKYHSYDRPDMLPVTVKDMESVKAGDVEYEEILLSDSSISDDVPENPDKQVPVPSDFISVMDEKENSPASSTQLEDFANYTSDQSVIGILDSEPYEYPTGHSKNLSTDRTTFDQAPKYSFERSEEDSEALPKTPYKPEVSRYSSNQSVGMLDSEPYEFTTSHSKNQLTNRRTFDQAPNYSFERSEEVFVQENSCSYRSSHRENPRRNTANFEAASKNSDVMHRKSTDFLSIGSREWTDRLDSDVVPRTPYKPEMVNFKDDGEWVLTMGHIKLPSTQRRESLEEPIMPPFPKNESEWRSPWMKKTPTKPEKSSEEIFPLIERILENAKRTKDESSLDKRYTDNYPCWDGQYFQSSSCSSIDVDLPQELSTPKVGRHYGGIFEEKLQDDFSQSNFSAGTEDSGFWSTNDGFGRSQNNPAEIQKTPRKEVKPENSVIAQLGLDKLLCFGNESGWRENSSGSAAGNTGTFDSVLSQERLSQPSNIHFSPWAKTQVQATTPRSLFQRNASITKPHCVTPSRENSLTPLPATTWGTPKFDCLSEPRPPRYESDHILSRFENVVASVKAEFSASDSTRSTKRARFDNIVRPAAPPALTKLNSSKKTNFPQSKRNVRQTLLSEIWSKNSASNQKVSSQTEPDRTESTNHAESNGDKLISSPNQVSNKIDQVPSYEAKSRPPPSEVCDHVKLPQLLTTEPSEKTVCGPTWNETTSTPNMAATNIVQGVRPLKRRFNPPPKKS